ncbi:MAG TPA: alpha/beta hydrolase, partial [Mesotoga infera]|nr:alpha/beta hydrolase [Mesotoga infera]
GYAVVLFDGPGQVGMRRFSPETPLRPDYEVPISKVVDYALSKEDVDPSKLALYGISLGGYFSLRAAANDSRIRALISNSPVTDIYKYMSAFAGEAINSPEDITLETVDLVPSEHLSKAQKLQLINIMLKYGRHSMFKAFERMKDFVVGDSIKSIQIPFLAMVSEGEGEEALSQA